MSRIFVASVLCLLTGLLPMRPAVAQDRDQSAPAPHWQTSGWINSNPLTLEQLRGRVVVVEFFQLWCPGCNRFSIPLMIKWERMFRGNPEIALVSIHSVFEGHEQQTPQRLLQFVAEKKIRHPVAIDRHQAGEPLPLTMQAYGVRGTPEIVIIDKKGKIRFQRFGSFDWFATERLIQQLMRE